MWIFFKNGFSNLLKEVEKQAPGHIPHVEMRAHKSGFACCVLEQRDWLISLRAWGLHDSDCPLLELSQYSHLSGMRSPPHFPFPLMSLEYFPWIQCRRVVNSKGYKRRIGYFFYRGFAKFGLRTSSVTLTKMDVNSL